MGKRCDEEFNPWPSFVDIFSSVILVLLLFLLITIVNIGYYAQFKYKVSYTGSVATDDLILNDDPSENKLDEEKKKENKKDKTPQVKNMSKTQYHDITQVAVTENDIKIAPEKRVLKPKDKIEKDTPYDLENVGVNLAEQFNDKTESEQQIIEKDDVFIVTYKENEVFVDDVIIVKIKEFITKMQKKYFDSIVYISAVDPRKQVSATVAKQISLGRSISTRNLVRKLGYDRNDVKIDLRGNIDSGQKIESDYGHLVIKVVKK